MHQLYNLVGHHAMPVDPMEYVPLTPDQSRVAYTVVPTAHGGKIHISTVFLGVDMRSERAVERHEVVRVFETRVRLHRGRGMKGKNDDPGDHNATYLWPTWETAEAEHNALVRRKLAVVGPHPHGDIDREVEWIGYGCFAAGLVLAVIFWWCVHELTGAIFGKPLILASIVATYLMGWAATWAWNWAVTIEREGET